ncbi:MAG: substrate-binding domain-containing protein [Parasporobacterium sp.]|nr:substrate-binding domain-containing protein [Parasporobacterium sp.]
MKKKISVLAAAVLVFVIAVASCAMAGEIKSTGPHGEQGVAAETINLTDEQVAKVKEGNYKVAIVMHYGGNDWATAQIEGIKQQCAEYGMEVIATTDANFSAEQQVSDIETVMALNPDIIISIPTDATATADAYKRAAEAGIKVVFMDNVADNMEQGNEVGQYVSCISADAYGNGCVAAELMGEALGGKGKVGMVFYDVNFFTTNLRDQGFKETMAEKYPEIEIVTEQGFTAENTCNEQGDAILTQFPDINGIYASWDIPMEGVLSSVRAAGKEGQIALTAIDLGNNIAREIAQGTVVGVGAQVPFDQGIAEVKCAALSLLGEEVPAFVVCAALPVNKDNVCEAYEQVYHIPAPEWLVEAAGK